MNRIPLTEISSELLADMRERVWMHTASVFAVDGSTPRYKRTATCIASGKAEYLLTAAHVWQELRGERFALSLGVCGKTAVCRQRHSTDAASLDDGT